MNVSRGELAERIKRNVERLKAPEYRYPAIFEREEDGWPGDWLGRTLLALCEQYEASCRSDGEILSRIEEIVHALPEHVNKDFYCGEILSDETVNEQQLSGNNWYIRALCAYYRISNDETVLNMLKKISQTFLLAAEPFYRTYPRERKESQGGVSGHLVNGAVGGWRLSSDVGCAFILLDAVADLYEVLRDEAVLALAKTIADNFLTYDYYACRFQTHAMLSATRGVVRIARLTGDKKYLSAAERNFSFYEENGRTVNYANFNWFQRSDSWTEPCAFIDSMILAVELYLLTRNEDYLRFANRVYNNAVRTAQRKNGGAGCETCLSQTNGELKIHLYEAYFCCTLRLANGLNYVRDRLFREENGAVFMLFALSGRYCTDEIDLNCDFDLNGGSVCITVNKGRDVTLYLCLPEGTEPRADEKYFAGREGCFVKLILPGTGKYTFRLSVSLSKETYHGKTVYFYGDSLLTRKAFQLPLPVRFSIDGKEYSPIADCITAEEKFGAEKYIQNV